MESGVGASEASERTETIGLVFLLSVSRNEQSGASVEIHAGLGGGTEVAVAAVSLDFAIDQTHEVGRAVAALAPRLHEAII